MKVNLETSLPMWEGKKHQQQNLTHPSETSWTSYMSFLFCPLRITYYIPGYELLSVKFEWENTEVNLVSVKVYQSLLRI